MKIFGTKNVFRLRKKQNETKQKQRHNARR